MKKFVNCELWGMFHALMSSDDEEKKKEESELTHTKKYIHKIYL